MHIYKDLEEDDKQVIYASILGDGCACLRKPIKEKFLVLSSSKKMYLEYKCVYLAKNLFSQTGFNPNSNSLGYNKKGIIYTKQSYSHPEITRISELPATEIVKLLNEVGFALWMFDDGSLHKKHLTYHLYTNSFSIDEVKEFIVLLEQLFNISGRLRFDRKKDGRCFPYIYFRKESSAIISTILEKYSNHELAYKIIPSSTTIPAGSSVQVDAKSETSEK